MTPAELLDRLGEVLTGCTASTSYGQVVLDVPSQAWVATATALRDDGALACDFFDVLTAVDELEAGLQVVVHLWSPRRRHGVLLRTRCPREDARVPSLTGVFAGADWHERHAAEMFGLRFDGHPGPDRLLLSPAFVGHPLRKDMVLAARAVRPWPGAKEPGESDADLARPRRRPSPPGVPQGWERP